MISKVVNYILTYFIIYANNHHTGMMENSTNNLKFSDSGNRSGNLIRWNETNTSTLPSADIYNNLINVVPVYTGCKLDISRNFSSEDLRSLDYDIPDEYLHQCLKTDYLLPQNGVYSTDNVKRQTKSSEVNQSVSVQINSSCEVEKKSIPSELYFRSFLQKDFQHSTRQILETIGYKSMEQEFLPINGNYHKNAEIFSKFNAGNKQEHLDQPFRMKHMFQKHPLIEIDNIINEDKLSPKIAGTFDKHFTNFNYNIGELNAQMKSVKCSDKKARLLKKRKPRTKLTANQLLFLNKAFAKNHYLTSEMAKLLSKRLEIPEMCIKTWFQNQRARYKCMNLNHRNSLNPCEGSGSFPAQSFCGIDNQNQSINMMHTIKL